MSEEVNISIGGFGGLNLKEPPEMIADNELSECVNFEIGRAGELNKRKGFTTLHGGGTLVNNVLMLGHYYTSTVSELLAKTATENIYKSVDGAVWTLLGASIQAQYGVQYAGKFYMVTETNFGIQVYDGAAITGTVGVGPPGSFCVSFKDRLFVLNTHGTGTLNSRLYFSGVGDFLNWPSTNFIDINPGDGDTLVACAVFHDTLIIFKTRSTWVLFAQGGPENWVLRNINPEIGCISKWTPVEIEGILYFVSANGVYKTDGQTFQNIAEPIDTIFTERVVNLANIDIDSAVWWEDKFIVLVHLPSGKRYMIYNIRTGSWSEWIPLNIYPSYFLPVLTSAPTKGVYCGNLEGSGKVFRFGDTVWTDSGATYPCYIKTKKFDFGLPANFKRGKWGAAVFKGAGDLTITHYPDELTTALAPIVGTAVIKAHKFKGPGYFRTLAMKFSYNSATDFKLLTINLLMHVKRTLIGSK